MWRIKWVEPFASRNAKKRFSKGEHLEKWVECIDRAWERERWTAAAVRNYNIMLEFRIGHVRHIQMCLCVWPHFESTHVRINNSNTTNVYTVDASVCVRPCYVWHKTQFVLNFVQVWSIGWTASAFGLPRPFDDRPGLRCALSHSKLFILWVSKCRDETMWCVRTTLTMATANMNIKNIQYSSVLLVWCSNGIAHTLIRLRRDLCTCDGAFCSLRFYLFLLFRRIFRFSINLILFFFCGCCRRRSNVRSFIQFYRYLIYPLMCRPMSLWVWCRYGCYCDAYTLNTHTQCMSFIACVPTIDRHIVHGWRSDESKEHTFNTLPLLHLWSKAITMLRLNRMQTKLNTHPLANSSPSTPSKCWRIFTQVEHCKTSNSSIKCLIWIYRNW